MLTFEQWKIGYWKITSDDEIRELSMIHGVPFENMKGMVETAQRREYESYVCNYQENFGSTGPQLLNEAQL
jgi:hypothetical protein